jgi:Flp pilus assembly protein TadD
MPRRDRGDRRYHDLCGRAAALAKGTWTGRRALREAVALRPNSLRGYQELALVHVNRKDYAAAADLYRHLNDLRPVSPEIMTNLGNVQALAGDFSGAIEAYRTALRFDPNFRTAREALTQVEAALKSSGR